MSSCRYKLLGVMYVNGSYQSTENYTQRSVGVAGTPCGEAGVGNMQNKRFKKGE